MEDSCDAKILESGNHSELGSVPLWTGDHDGIADGGADVVGQVAPNDEWRRVRAAGIGKPQIRDRSRVDHPQQVADGSFLRGDDRLQQGTRGTRAELV